MSAYRKEVTGVRTYIMIRDSTVAGCTYAEESCTVLCSIIGIVELTCQVDMTIVAGLQWNKILFRSYVGNRT